MRFSQKHYPVLGHIESFEALMKFQEDGLTHKIVSDSDFESFFKTVATSCSLITESKTIDFVSIPFFEKCTTGKIFEKLTDLFSDIEPCEGLLLYPKKRFSKIHAVGYIVFPTYEDKDDKTVEIHLYCEQGRVVILYVQIKEKTVDWKAVISDSVKKSDKEHLDGWFINHIQTLLSILTFKQFAEIEVKEIGGIKYPKKLKIGNEKYLNESNSQINILDSRWFTQTVRSDGFAVSGHFRLQPYGEGRSQKRLIYIQDFEKKGYTRKAKIQ